APLPFLVAQHELLDLAGRGLRQIPELDSGRRLEMRDVLLAEVDDVLLGRLLARLERDEGLGPLPPLLVRDGHDRALHHRRVLGHALLHLDGRDVLAARDDDVLLPVAQLDVAVRVPHTDVPRVEPAAAEGLRRRLRLVEITLGAVVPDHDHLAQRLAIPRHVFHLGIDDTDEVEDGVALPLPRGERRLLLGGQAVPLRVPGAYRVRAVGLGQAVDVHRLEVELLQLAQERWRGRRAGHGDRDWPREAVRLEVVDHADLDGGGAAVVRDGLGLEQLPDARGLDAPKTDVGARDRRHRPREAPAVAVEHRQRPEVVGVEAHPRLDDLAHRVDPGTAMRVHDALGPAGRARSVVDGDGFLLVLEHGLDRTGGAGGEEVLVGIAGRARVV